MRSLLLAGLALAGPASADDATVEEIVVTGSRIARRDFESMSPIVTIPEDAFEQSGAIGVDAVLNRFPQFVPDFTGTSNNPSNGGQGNVQLRGLGTRATLVLLDGRRLVPANGTGVVDVNIVPPALVERVEVITGGASAVYGSDAVAGVVNFRLKEDFEGLEIDGGYAGTDRGDGGQYDASVTAGARFAAGRGKVLGFAGYSRRDPIYFPAREFTKSALFYAGPGAGGVGPGGAFLPAGTAAIEEGVLAAVQARPDAFDSLFASYGHPVGSVPYQDFLGVNADDTLFTLGNGEPGSVVNFRGERDEFWNDRFYGFNAAPWAYLQMPIERTSLFARAGYGLDGGAEVYGQALYASYSADQSLAPAPSYDLTIPADNPFIPADARLLLDSRALPDERVRVFKRFTELGPRVASNDYDAWQATAGVRGPLRGDWTWDAYAQYGANDRTEKQRGNALRSRINELTEAEDGGASICGEFSLLGKGRMPAACIDYIATGGTNRQSYGQAIVEASVEGPALQLPAGDLRVALGAMVRHDDFTYEADPAASVVLEDGLPDIIGFEASDDIDGSDANTDVYVEGLVPLLADRPGVERLEAGLGYRYSHYDSAGGVDSWKAELLYQPVQRLKLRGSLQRAVRAPSVFELYQPRLPVEYLASTALGGFTDPCEAGSPERSGPDATQVESLCIAQGVPAALLPGFADSDLIHRGVQGGNPDLDPETARTLTAGVVVDAGTGTSTLQISVDWYRIGTDDAIEYVFAPTYVPFCYDARTNPGFSPSNAWCGFFSRDAQSGEIASFEDVLVNIDGYEVSGIDLQLDWTRPAGPGEIRASALVSWMDTFEVKPPPGLPTENKVGTVGFNPAGLVIFDIGGSRPQWKGQLDLAWALGAATLGTRWRYIAGMKDVNPEVNYSVPAYDYVDVYGAWTPIDALTLRAGVENLGDRDPPLLPSAVNANTDASQYDVLGRRYYVNLSYRF